MGLIRTLGTLGSVGTLRAFSDGDYHHGDVGVEEHLVGD